MFSCEFSEIFQNIFFTEHLRATASALISKLKNNVHHWLVNIDFFCIDYLAYCFLICTVNCEVYEDLLQKLDEEKQTLDTLEDELNSDQHKYEDYDENNPEYKKKEFKNIPSSMMGPDGFPMDLFAVNDISEMDGKGLIL